MTNLNTLCIISQLEIFLCATEWDFIHFDKAETKTRDLTLVSRHLCQEKYETLLLQVEVSNLR